MQIERLSIKSATTIIFVMLGIVAILLSLLAGNYFHKSALNAQLNSLSRVVEVATAEMQQRIREHSFDLGMELAHSDNLISAFQQARTNGNNEELDLLLDDPFISGFVGFSRINLVKLRAYDTDLLLVGQSTVGIGGIKPELPQWLVQQIRQRPRSDRLKGIDALWLSADRALFSAVVPLGGLRPVGYLEVVVDPVFNLAELGDITRMPVSIFNMAGELEQAVDVERDGEYLPVEYLLHTSAGEPAFRVVGLEDVALLSADMARIKTATISLFLVLTFGTLLLALWLFNRFMLAPVGAMARTMREMAVGKLDMRVDDRALREFHELADTFNRMAEQVRLRTRDLERLLDLDDNAILCIDSDGEVVYFNRSATTLFGYPDDTLTDLDVNDLFVDGLHELPAAPPDSTAEHDKLHKVLTCRHQQGHEFRGHAVITPVDVLGEPGHAIAFNAAIGDAELPSQQNEQRLQAVESLTSLLQFAQYNPSLMPGMVSEQPQFEAAASDKALIRERAVTVMTMALACWEHDLGQSKLELAEQSGIWPVYIDKSTPTTRTLDKYLSLDSCPKNPRSKRVIDTAEFVLRTSPDSASESCSRLHAALEDFRQLLSGVPAPVTAVPAKETSVSS